MRIGPLACLAAACLALAACGPQIDESTYEQISVGMTISEVQSLLGSDGVNEVVTGTEISSAGVMSGTSSADSSRQQYVWKEDGLNKPAIIVNFDNGMVVSKSKQNF